MAVNGRPKIEGLPGVGAGPGEEARRMARGEGTDPGGLTIYTDGACSGNPGPGGWGTVLVRGEAYEELGGREERTTNNRMEMRAAAEGLRRAAPGDRVHVVTDSKYLHDGILKWIRAWKRRGWKKADGAEVLNRDLWEELDGLCSRPGIRVTWEHVRGHSGHLLNERCDRIATGFARGTPPVLERWAAGEGRPAAADARGEAGEDLAYPAYLSWVDGEARLDRSWPTCEARVKGRGGARFKKVRSPAEYRATLSTWGLDPARVVGGDG